MSFLLAIDIGGTLTKFSLISSDKTLLNRKEIQTPCSFNDLYQELNIYLESEIRQGRSMTGIAISSPGSIAESGEVLGYSAVSFLHNENLIRRFEERYRVPISVENDANCAALAEKWNGAASDLLNYACIVCGTGVGGALVLNGHIWKGANLHGGEFGYAILSSELESLTYFTWSELGSSSAILRRLEDSRLVEKEWTGERAFTASAEGHVRARESIETFFHHLAVGVFNIQYMLDPQKILIGGGITRQPDFLSLLAQPIDHIYEAMPYARIRPDVALCQHLADAQLLGAAYVWHEKYGEW